ncbi:MAG: ferritin-like domain-containing protein [Alphaproteobacteria bacterium]
MSLAQDIVSALAERGPVEKCQQVRSIFTNLVEPNLGPIPLLSDTPGREEQPKLVPPSQVPKRRISRGIKGRFALLHALAHIELNAVNLALDIAVRFGTKFGSEFVKDWLSVADDEAKHFLLLHDRLYSFGGKYGDLPAHDGLWMSAVATKDEPLARLAVVPMVLEARGLDVTPGMIKKLELVGDIDSVSALKVIYADEVNHVALGRKWFEHACKLENLEPVATWQSQVKLFFNGILKRPFNEPARTSAGMTPAYYEPLADWYEAMGF